MILSKLATLFFEPILIIMLLGIAGFLFSIKRKKVMRWGRLLLVLLAVMILWRCFFAQSSSRYWASTLIPGLLFCSYCLFMPCWGIRFSRIGLGIVVIICLGKDFHLNWNNRAIIRATSIMEEASRKWQKPLCIEYKYELHSRLAFYTKLPFLNRNVDSIESLNGSLGAAQGLYDVVYLLAFQTQDEVIEMQNFLNAHQGKLIFSQYTDRHKKKKVCLYSIPIPPQRELNPDQVEVFRNGNFEKLSLQKDQISYFPEAWEKEGDNLSFATEPINGTISLAMKGIPKTELHPWPMKIPSVNEKIIFKVKKAVGATISIYGDYGTSTPRYTILHRQDIASMRVSTNELHTFQVPWTPMNDLGATWVRLDFHITAPNGLIIDDVELYPLEEEKN